MSTAFETGFVPKSIEFEGQTYRYAVWVPGDYAPAKRWPVVLFLHGMGESGALVVMPQLPVDCRWEGPMQDLALATLDATLREYNGDRDRIVLTGLSLGGYGTWLLGGRYPEKFCALLPICGGGNPADAAKLARLPIWCFHGDADAAVPVERSREMVEAVRAAGGQVRYTELPGVEHNSWDPTYEDPEVIEWMLAQRRRA